MQSLQEFLLIILQEALTSHGEQGESKIYKLKHNYKPG